MRWGWKYSIHLPRRRHAGPEISLPPLIDVHLIVGNCFAKFEIIFT